MAAGLNLIADCDNCFGLCCVAPAFAASPDFAIDKPAGVPCPHLQPDSRCDIHPSLIERGFSGCMVFDCYGAGQKVSQLTFGGRDRRDDPALAEQMFDAFAVMRTLHDLLWYLAKTLALPSAEPIHNELSEALAETERLTRLSPDRLLRLDVAAQRDKVAALLLRAGELIQAGVLQALAAALDRTRTGRELIRETRLDQNSLEPVLRRLIAAGQVSQAARGAGRGRHEIAYTLTSDVIQRRSG